MADRPTADSSVTSTVPTTVTEDAERGGPASNERNRDAGPRFAHLFWDAAGWSFQRQVPHSLIAASRRRTLKARLGPLRRGDARRASRHLGQLTDALFAVVGKWKSTMQFDGMSPCQSAYVQERMTRAFNSEIERLRIEGISDPMKEAPSIVLAMSQLDADLRELASPSSTVARYFDVDEAKAKVEDEQRRILGKHEFAKGDAEFNGVLRPEDDLGATKASIARARTSKVVMAEFMAATFDILNRAPGYVAHEEAYKASQVSGGDTAAPEDDPEITLAAEERTDSSNATTAGSRIRTQRDMGQPTHLSPAHARDLDVAMFAGSPDRRVVPRPEADASPYPLLSQAAGKWLSE